MNNSSKSGSNLDPNLRERLLRESKNPFRGLRRILWITLFGSASFGLFIMFSRFLTGDIVSLNDFGIQIMACIVCGSLIWLDRSKAK